MVLLKNNYESIMLQYYYVKPRGIIFILKYVDNYFEIS